MTIGKSCAKIILFGEHAVVYGKPGLAVPIKNAYTLATVSAEPFSYSTDKELNEEETLRMSKMFKVIIDHLNLQDKNLSVNIESNIPLASGMGSSASLSVAIIKAYSNYLDLRLTNERINEISMDCERIFHGNPSGIDNTVITYERPVYYKNRKIEFLTFKKPLSLILANTGISSSTKDVVAEIRANFEATPKKYLDLFNAIEAVVEDARICLVKGDIKGVGSLMTKNHELLGLMGVSSIQLDAMVDRALKAGAYGAKLVGAGKGGNVVALVDENRKERVMNELKPLSKDIRFAVVL